MKLDVAFMAAVVHAAADEAAKTAIDIASAAGDVARLEVIEPGRARVLSATLAAVQRFHGGDRRVDVSWQPWSQFAKDVHAEHEVAAH